MTCVTCDGAGYLDPPPKHPKVDVDGWIVDGETPCPVCKGPHVRKIVAMTDAADQVIECSVDDCTEPVALGSLVYAQLTSSKPPVIDEAIYLCCDLHAERTAEEFRQAGHPAVCLPFFIDDARD